MSRSIVENTKIDPDPKNYNSMMVENEMKRQKKKRIAFTKTEVHMVESYKKYNKRERVFCCYSF